MSASDGFGGFKIEKLGDDNFHVWKQKVELVLAFRELEDHITEHELPSAPDKLREWKRRDAKARAVIGLTLSDDHLDHVRGAETALEMWNSVLNIFQGRTLLNKIKARRKFYSAKMEDDERVLVFINRVRQLASDLKSMEVSVNDEDIAMTILCGLPERFEHLIVAIDTVADDSNLTLDFVKSRLLQEEQRINDRGNASTKPDSALMAGKRRDFKCTYCKKKGHTEPYCFKKRDELARQRQSSSGLIGNGKQSSSSAAQINEDSDDSGDYVCLMSKINNGPKGTSSAWYIDSGATSHMTFNKSLFKSLTSVQPFDVGMGDNSAVKAVGHGTVHVDIIVNGKTKKCLLQNVAYVPDLRYNLISVSTLERMGMTIEFGNSVCNIRKGHKTVAQGSRKNSLYCLNIANAAPSGPTEVALVTDLGLWHARLAHVHMDGIRNMVRNKVVSGIDTDLKQDIGICESCVYGKSCGAPIPKQGGDRAKGVLDLVHSDVMGPFQVPSLGGSRYFVSFIDDYSRYATGYCIKTKSQVFDCFKKWLAKVERQTGAKLKTFRCDNGMEYMSNEFKTFLKDRGIQYDFTVPYNPHQNGVAERLNRTLAELVRSMLHHKNVAKHFWAEAINVAMYIRNRVTSRGIPSNVTPYQLWTGKKPNLEHLRVFGSKCWYTIRENGLRKLDERAREAIFIGYTQRSGGYKLWDISNLKVVVSRDVRFDELNTSCESHVEVENDNETNSVPVEEDRADMKASPQSMNDVRRDDEVLPPNNDQDGDTNNDDDELVPSTLNVPSLSNESSEDASNVRRSTRNRRAPGSWWKASAFLSAAVPTDPQSYKQAISCPESEGWTSGMKKEYDSLMEHDTWVLEPPPKDQNIVSNRWVYVTKDEVTPDGKTNKRYKARLVARGFSQVEGVDYNETYAPVVKFTSVRILLAVVTALRLHLHQMDVVTAFLNGDLDETVYMAQPEGFKVKGKEHWVCRLQKAIYGLKQASRQWYKKMDEFLIEKLGLKRNIADDCIYSSCNNGGVLIIALYVDDLLIGCSDMEKLQEVKLELSKRFRMKDLNEARKCLGFEIERDLKAGTLRLCQRKYSEKILARFEMSSANGCSTPMETGIDLNAESEAVTDVPYRQAIGSLMYLMVGTRPDIAFAVTKLAKHVENPCKVHWQGVTRLFRYIIQTIAKGICYDSNKRLEPYGYVDADWASDISSRKSTSGFVFVMAGGAISWCSRQQEVVALSSTEAEYISLCTGMKEGIWLKRFISNLGIGLPLCTGPMLLHVDNQGAMDLASNGSTNRRTKHIDVRYHFCRQSIQDKLVSLKYCPTKDMAADVFTKALGRVKIEDLVPHFGLEASKHVTEGGC